MAGEVSLVIEADGYRHLSRGDAGEQKRPSGINPTTDEVSVGTHAKGRGEAPNQVGNAPAKHGCGLSQRERFGHVFVEQQPKLVGNPRFDHVQARRLTEMGPDPVPNEGQATLGIQGFLADHQGVVEVRQRSPEPAVGNDRLVDGGAGELCRQLVGVEVQIPLPESIVSPTGRPAVVHDSRWQKRHRGLGGGAAPRVE